MDGCLINTKSGKTFPQNKEDWVLWKPDVPKILKKKLEGTPPKAMVIFTNQGGILKGKTPLSDISDKIDEIQKKLDIPLTAFILAKDDCNRKPCTGAWDLFCKKYNGGLEVDLKESLFIGDAAGRPKTKERKKDFNNSDLKYALNIGCGFQTPEKFFLGFSDSDVPTTFEFDPRKLGVSPKPRGFDVIQDLEVMIFVGAPGSGKSTVSKTVFGSYAHVNRDTLKTKEKCIAAAEQALRSKRNVVIDNQNKSPEDRKPFIELARKHGAKVRAVYFDVPKDFCFHANDYRAIYGTEKRDKVPPMIIHAFYKNAVRPEKEVDEYYTFTLDMVEVKPEHDKFKLFF